MNRTNNVNPSKIREKSIELLKKENLFKTPINVEELAQKLSIEVIEEDLDKNISGFLMVKNNNSIAVINSRHHKNRKRFTLAHEIGHFVLHKRKDEELLFMEESLTYFRSKNNLEKISESEKKIEREANLFAAELLMPKVLVSKTIEEKCLDIDNEYDFTDLATIFKVSEVTLAIRLKELGLCELGFR